MERGAESRADNGSVQNREWAKIEYDQGTKIRIEIMTAIGNESETNRRWGQDRGRDPQRNSNQDRARAASIERAVGKPRLEGRSGAPSAVVGAFR
ncbi:hypothetical protein EVAR_64364_1 [Eumeta japonica]|uniref:Uncharacterized protein n=1 Tax=Eumeta variegata TaxID=151549 RepID=A0A4C2A0G2_EUMVA|nr:hypothetical protein EVAR_64364_1 [Eumeta japonica]